MTSPPDAAEVVVVGAGLAGLNAARELRLAGVDVVVLEGAPEVGGRVSTDIVDGYLLDRGFQLYNPAYPEGRRVLDYEALDLQAFGRGASVRLPGRSVEVVDPRSRPQNAWRLLRVPGGPLAGARFARYAATCGYRPVAGIKERPDAETGVVLRNTVHSRAMLEELLRPFLAGVLADWPLTTSRHYTDLVLRSFVRGTPSLPAGGMAQIPRGLALAVGSDRIHCDVPVRSVTADRVHHDGGSLRAAHVIVATDGGTAARLVPGVPEPHVSALTTWYFVARPDEFPGDPRLLAVDGARRGPLANVAAVSAVAPGYAPGAGLLIAASAVGRHGDEPAVRNQLSQMFGRAAERWPLLARYEIPRALPHFPVGQPLAGQQDFAGILVAGDHRDTPSLQGALVSGRRAARAVLDRLGPT